MPFTNDVLPLVFTGIDAFGISLFLIEDTFGIDAELSGALEETTALDGITVELAVTVELGITAESDAVVLAEGSTALPDDCAEADGIDA